MLGFAQRPRFVGSNGEITLTFGRRQRQKKRRENDLLLNGEWERFFFFDPKNCPSFESFRQSTAAAVETFQQKC